MTNTNPNDLAQYSNLVAALTKNVLKLLDDVAYFSVIAGTGPLLDQFGNAAPLVYPNFTNGSQRIKEQLLDINRRRESASCFVVDSRQWPEMVLYTDYGSLPLEDSFEIRAENNESFLNGELTALQTDVDIITTTRCDDFLREKFYARTASYHQLLIDAAVAVLNDLSCASSWDAVEQAAREWINAFGLIAASADRFQKHLQAELALATDQLNSLQEHAQTNIRNLEIRKQQSEAGHERRKLTKPVIEWLRGKVDELTKGKAKITHSNLARNLRPSLEAEFNLKISVRTLREFISEYRKQALSVSIGKL